MNSYELSRSWFDFCFENPERINSNHTALYFFVIEHCNRLGWKEKFGLPSQMAMDAIGIKNWRTYSKTLNDLIDFGFVKCIQKSKNQYSATIVAIVKNTKATTKALDKALQKHSQKQSKSIVGIDKPNNIETNKPNNIEVDFLISLYPDFCKGRNTSTRKGGESIKKKIIKLLKSKTKDEVEASIKSYVGECEKSNTYLMNFSKFLDELPEPIKVEKPIIPELDTKYIYFKFRGEPKARRIERDQFEDYKTKKESHGEDVVILQSISGLMKSWDIEPKYN
tara:strand:+ start:28 stop:867 length:840 start_codon:yes stop_codon:yes gene_type:complete